MTERTSAKRTGDQAIRVADALREKIVSGELKPGEALRQERLAVVERGCGLAAAGWRRYDQFA